MTDYRTKIVDDQLVFGSGSGDINAADIPESATRFWLTNLSQEVSGSKIFGNNLDMSFNSIINVATPVDARDAVTKQYVDDIPGLVPDLQSVTDNGATTDNAITVSASGSAFRSLLSTGGITAGGTIAGADLKSYGNVHVNYNGAAGDSDLLFGNGTLYLRWRNSDSRFELSNQLYLDNGGLTQNGPMIIINADAEGTGAISYIYFNRYDAHFKYNGTTASFGMDKQLSMGNHKIVDVTDPYHNQDVATKNYVDNISGSTLQDATDNGATTDNAITVSASGSAFRSLLSTGGITAGGTVVGSTLVSNGNIKINRNGPDGDSYLYFYNGNSPTGASLMWDDSPGEFVINQQVRVVGALSSNSNITTTAGDIIAVGDAKLSGDVYIHYDGPDGNSALYFYEASSPTGASLVWNNTVNYFIASHSLNAPTILSDGNININNNGPDGDSYLYFYDGSAATGKSLMWDDSPGEFILNGKVRIPVSGSAFRSLLSTGGITAGGTIEARGQMRCDTFRIDTYAAVETITPDKTITISVNGVNYKIPIKAA